QEAVTEGLIAGEPQPEVAEQGSSEWTSPSSEPPIEPAPADELSMEEAAAGADEWRRLEPAEEAVPSMDEPTPTAEESPAAVEEEFVGYAPIAEEDEPRRRWPLILGILVLIVAA